MVLTSLVLTVLLLGGNSQPSNLSIYGSLSRQQTVRENLRLRESALELKVEERRREMVRRNTPAPVMPTVVLAGRDRPRIVGYTNGRGTVCVRDTSCYYRGRRR
jgi:hypothetical protein